MDRPGIKVCFEMETQTTGAELAQSKSTSHTQPQRGCNLSMAIWHPLGQTNNAGRGRRGPSWGPWGRGAGRRNQKKEEAPLCVGESTKPGITHQFVVRISLNGFPNKSTEHPFPLPSWMDVARKSVASFCLLCVSLVVAQSNSFLKGQPL